MDLSEDIVQSLKYEFREVTDIISRYNLDVADYLYEDNDIDATVLDLSDAMEDAIKEDYELRDSIRDSITEVMYGDADTVISNMKYIRYCDYDDEYLGEAFRNEEWGVLESIVREGVFSEDWYTGTEEFIHDNLKEDITDYVQSFLGSEDVEIESQEEDYDEGFGDIEESLRKRGWR